MEELEVVVGDILLPIPLDVGASYGLLDEVLVHLWRGDVFAAAACQAQDEED